MFNYLIIQPDPNTILIQTKTHDNNNNLPTKTHDETEDS